MHAKQGLLGAFTNKAIDGYTRIPRRELPALWELNKGPNVETLIIDMPRFQSK